MQQHGSSQPGSILYHVVPVFRSTDAYLYNIYLSDERTGGVFLVVCVINDDCGDFRFSI